MREWAIVVEAAKPDLANAYRRLHWRARAARDATWRAMGHVLTLAAKAKLAEGPVTITVSQECRRGVLPDPGATFPTVKALVDGMVDAGALAGDTSEHIAAITWLAPVRGDTDRLVLTVRAQEEEGT